MKKIGFFIVALLVLAMFGCVDFTPPEAVKGQSNYDDGLGPLQPGEFFVGLSKTGGRALTAPLARAGADFFEVVFTDGSEFRRATLREGTVVRMRAPTLGVYDNAAALRAYVFAGREQTKTLLGIGMIGEVDDGLGSAPGNEITADTISVTFFLEALLTDINTTNAPATSTFTIAGTGTEVMAVPGTTNPEIPVFLFPINDTDCTALYSYRITNTHTFGVNLFNAVLFAATAPYVNITTREYILDGHDQPLAKIEAELNGLPAVVGPNIEVNLDIETPNLNGLGLLYIEIPVHLLDATVSTSPSAVQWYIRGGLNNALVDTGITANENAGSQGGAVITGVGNVFDGAGFEVKVDNN